APPSASRRPTAAAGGSVTAPRSRSTGRVATRNNDHPSPPFTSIGVIMQSLTLAQASTIVDVALKTGRDKKFQPLSVAVLDAGGHLVAFKREDKSGILRFDIAFGKAGGALGMGLGSRTLAERAGATPQFFTMLAAVSQGRMVCNPAGVLIRDADGDVIGAV